tara:strand:- start:1049 stop:2275 length:1227 start_codon:yes stop_codon:yes gene_type:complete
MKKKFKIGVIGLGYVGLPLALSFSKYFNTCAYDYDEDRVKKIKTKVDLNKEVKIKKNKCIFDHRASVLADCNIFIVSVPTPVDRNNIPDLKNILSATSVVSKYLKKNDIVVYESTVYPGTTEKICVPLIAKNTSMIPNKDFFYGYSPERVNPGDKSKTIEKIIKIVSGSNKKTLDTIDFIYSKIIKAGTFKVDKIEIAESAKIIENIQRDVNVALMNEFVKIFDKLKIDFNSILEAASTKWNFLNFKPGLVGGHCIGVDPYYLTYLASKKGFNPDLIIQARKINEKMANFHSNKILNLLNKKIKGKKILICGFSFKANCSDYRNTGVFKLYNILKKKNSKVDVFDPLINSKKVYLDHKLQLVTKVKKNYYDVVVLAVDHKKFKKLGKKYFENLLSKRGQIYDLKNLFS